MATQQADAAPQLQRNAIGLALSMRSPQKIKETANTFIEG